jgi:hypothetical protein
VLGQAEVLNLAQVDFKLLLCCCLVYLEQGAVLLAQVVQAHLFANLLVFDLRSLVVLVNIAWLVEDCSTEVCSLSRIGAPKSLELKSHLFSSPLIF